MRGIDPTRAPVLRRAGGPVTTIDTVTAAACDRRPPAADPASRDLYDHPETAWEEVRSARRVAGQLSDNGFDVTDRYCGLDTAFAARIGCGDLHVALCAEYDALPGLGHACGHNLISAITVGAALALAPVVDDLGLTLTVLGTPAEEGGGGKIEMLERDGFAGQHAAAMVHPGPVDVARARPFAVSHSHIEYAERRHTPPPIPNEASTRPTRSRSHRWRSACCVSNCLHRCEYTA